MIKLIKNSIRYQVWTLPQAVRKNFYHNIVALVSKVNLVVSDSVFTIVQNCVCDSVEIAVTDSAKEYIQEINNE
jgi:hypothetical protein